MKTKNSRILSHALSFGKAWLCSRLIPFYQSLSPWQRTGFLLGIAPAPIYVFNGQLFDLLDAVRASIEGQSISILPFVALLTETLLIIYTASLVIQYHSATNRKVFKPINFAAQPPHKCITVCAVPLHLYNEEKKTSAIDDTEFIKGFGLDSEDQMLIDRLPQALEILKNNAAMLDIYEQHHPEAEHVDAAVDEYKSLMDILRESLQPEIETASDIEQIIHSPNS